MAREEKRNLFKATAISESVCNGCCLGHAWKNQLRTGKFLLLLALFKLESSGGKEASAEKMPTSDRPAGKTVGAFSSKWEGPGHCGRATLRRLLWFM